ncbi:hepatic lectin-like isoform X2 [Pristis pectinata]|uniref:hepatic lectin-like isoform X2 n=1 Tax=Pristis pectinata TaxID=685728 RepID=UPI00223DC250|nr:hepatic lectin-like isoform X2 [Pristis pectinata]
MDRKDDYETPKRSIRGRLSPLVIYTLLGLAILMSFVILGTAVHLITGNSEEVSVSLAKLKAELAELTKNLSHGRPFNQWRRFNHKLYYFSSSRHSWNESMKFCASMKSQLVVINSNPEQEFIQRNIKCGHWIGLHDTVVEGVWRWVDGTDYATGFKNWAAYQPSNMGLGLGTDCALVTGTGGWYAWHCDSWHYPLCEKPED